jgi:glutathione S-transferase
VGATLYAIPGSHPSRSAELMLRHKGIDYRRVNFVPGTHRLLVRLRGFPGDRVPAVMLDGRRAQGTREIARALDEFRLDPRLVPDDPLVEEAERWGEQQLQPWARRTVAAAGARNPDALRERGAAGRLGRLLTRRDLSRRMMMRTVLRVYDATAEVQRADRAAVGEMLDHVDRLIADGVLNGRELNAADFQIVTSLALVDYVVELRPAIRSRPLLGLLDRVLPEPSAQ